MKSGKCYWGGMKLRIPVPPQFFFPLNPNGIENFNHGSAEGADGEVLVGTRAMTCMSGGVLVAEADPTGAPAHCHHLPGPLCPLAEAHMVLVK